MKRTVKTQDLRIAVYLEKRKQLAQLEKELIQERADLLDIGAYKSDMFELKTVQSRREYLKSLGDLKERFTPAELKGLLGISKVTTLRIVTVK